MKKKEFFRPREHRPTPVLPPLPFIIDIKTRNSRIQTNSRHHVHFLSLLPWICQGKCRFCLISCILPDDLYSRRDWLNLDLIASSISRFVLMIWLSFKLERPAHATTVTAASGFCFVVVSPFFSHPLFFIGTQKSWFGAPTFVTSMDRILHLAQKKAERFGWQHQMSAWPTRNCM